MAQKINQTVQQKQLPGNIDGKDLMRAMDFDDIAEMRQVVQGQTMQKEIDISAEDCAKLLKSFADAEMFDVDLMHALERLFVEKIAFATGP